MEGHKKSRKLSPFNIFMKAELKRVKKANPKMDHKEAFKTAAKNWHGSSKAKSHKVKAKSHKLKAKSHKVKAKSHKVKAKSHKLKAKSHKRKSSKK